MKSIATLAFVLALITAFLFPMPACATSSLAFEGGGYWVDMEIGQDQRPTIARIRFHAPGDTIGIVLPTEHVSIDVFDPKRQRLSLRYSGGSGVAPFQLSADGAIAILTIGSKRLSAVFSWSM
ncbi:hypothetical protein [Lysobacter tyrosinilyticus]